MAKPHGWGEFERKMEGGRFGVPAKDLRLTTLITEALFIDPRVRTPNLAAAGLVQGDFYARIPVASVLEDFARIIRELQGRIAQLEERIRLLAAPPEEGFPQN